MCGIAGIFGHLEAANLTYLMSYAQQHRGQEGAGIVASDSQKLYSEKGIGKIRDIFTKDKIEKLTGKTAIGHNRYSTTGSPLLSNIQPINTEHFAICHNGNLVNAPELKRKLEESGAVFQTTTDTEVILHLIAQSKKTDFLEKLSEALQKIKGSFSLLILTKDKLIAVRDPLGFRPLCFGELDGAYVLASESCAFDLIGAKYKREIKPGEILVIESNSFCSFFPFPNPKKTAFCIFELIYFARPDSFIFNDMVVYFPRTQFGRELSKEDSVKTDCVMPIPDSSNHTALGYNWQSGIPFDFGIIRSHYKDRTFIEPEQEIRYFGVKLKFNPIPEAYKGKTITIVDDSIVRGITSQKMVSMLFSVGAKEVHFRVGSPPIKFPCFFGIDISTEQELIASRLSTEEIRKKIRATTLKYLSVEGMYRAVEACGFSRNDFCDACFTGNYPINIPKNTGKFSLEK